MYRGAHPKMVAFQTNKLSSLAGDAEQPSGGSCLMDFKSLSRRSIAADVMVMGTLGDARQARLLEAWFATGRLAALLLIRRVAD